jgi:ribosomal protein L18E
MALKDKRMAKKITHEILIKRLKEKRKSINISQLARTVGVDKSCIVGAMNGKSYATKRGDKTYVYKVAISKKHWTDILKYLQNMPTR